MKKLVGSIVAVIAVLVIASLAQAQYPEDLNTKESFTDSLTPSVLSLTESYRSRYVLSNGVVSDKRPVLQTDAFLATKCGLSIDVWQSLPVNLHGIGENYATETDLTIGYNRKLFEECVNLSVGVAYYDLHPSMKLGGADLVCGYIELSHDFKATPKLTLTPFVRSETYFNMCGSVKGDTMPRAGVKLVYDVTSYLAITGQTYVLYDPGMLDKPAFVGNIEASAVWKLSKNWKLELPYVRYEGPFNGTDDGRRPQFVTGGGLSFSF